MSDDAALPFTGERFTPECVREIWYEHWHRYAFARRLGAGRRVLDAACGEGYGSALLAKVALGEADAGFVYSTDAKTVSGRVSVIGLPATAQPTVRYGICIVEASGDETAARAFVAKVLSRAGQARLVAAGFLPRAKPKPAKR